MFKIKAQETGRSMVEMLGVLAVIGVLSIAGIAGYRYAMDKYIANDVLHESNIRGFDVSANFKGKRLPDVREIGGFAKYTGTGKPIAVYPNPEDFNWAEYADKCPTEERCQAFDVEVKNLNKRQCQMIMQSGWTLPDAYLVSISGVSGGENSGEDVVPIAGVSSTRGIQKTASDADSGLCDDFDENEQGIAIRFRFVSVHADFDDEDYEYGDGGYDPDDGEGEGETGSGGSSGSGSETGGGTGGETGGEGTGGTETPPETPAPVECTGNTESDGAGGCRCKADYYPEGSCTTKCESPRSWLDGACKCASGNWNGTSCVTCGTNEQWNGSDCVCDSSSYKSGNSCVQCPVNSTVNANRDGCVCGASDSYWDGSSCTSCGTNQQVNSSKTGCECKANWHGTGCATYCDTSVASISGGTCVCNNATTYWNPSNKTCESCGSNKEWNGSSCVCNEQSYPDGDSCIQCPSGSTPTSTGCSCSGTNTHWNGSSCITCDSNATFKDNGCVCNSGYYGTGTNCTVCERPRRTNASNTTCDCPSGTIWMGEETNRCEEADDGGNGGSGGTGLCDAGMIWNSTLGECVSESCSGTAGCPQGYVCDITDSKCIKNWDCENPHSLDISETECSECANRVWSEDGKCVACPSNQIRLDTGLCGCTNICPQNQSQNPETCACYCDETKYEEMPDTTGMCICKTEDVMALDLVSDAQNSGGMDCKITVADLGYLNGTYYFEWVDGFHYYECESRSVGFSVFLFAESTNLGYILNVDKPESHYVCYYQDSVSLENALKNNPIKYFSFDGSQKITLQFWDDHCYDNCGSMNFKLHKVIDYCITNSCSNTNMCTEGSICDLTDGICINNWNCENPHSLDISETECFECANRVWSEDGKCAACPGNQVRLDTGLCGCPLDMPYLEDGTTCVTDCSSGKRDDNTCVESCPTERSYLDEGVCVATCGTTNKYLNGTTCVSSCPTDKPYLNGTQCVASCSSGKRDGNTCVSSCPTARPYVDDGVCVATCPSNTYLGNNNVCVNVTTWCTQQMQNAGYSTSRFTVSGITITYKSDMTVSTALDISKCNLTVQGKLTVNSEKSLNALVVSATSSSSQGVNNTGTITVTELTGISTTSQYGINNTGTITVSNGTIIGESATSHGIYNTGTSAQITAKTITGKNSATSKSYYGLYVDSGTVKATSSITGTGGSGIYNKETMTGITITGTGTAGYGVYNKAGIITATGTITGYGTSGYGIFVDDGTITAVSVNGTSEESDGIIVDTSLIATGNVTGKTNATKNYAGIYMYTSSSYLKAKNVLGIATDGGTEFGYGIKGTGTIEASETIIGKGADTGISGPTLKAQQITGEATKGDGTGLSATVTATGNVVGDGGPKGTGIFSSTITTTGDVIGKSVVKIGVQGGKINAKNIIGTSVDSIGVEIVGTNMPVTVTENITGISETGYGVYLSYTNISAKNIYYCKKYYKSNSSNSVKCASGCTCTN